MATTKRSDVKDRDSLIKFLTGLNVQVKTPEPIERFHSGSHAFDYFIGGGLPRERVVQVYGKPAHGKTTLTHLMTKAAIERGEKVFRFETEGFSYEWADMLGLPFEATDNEGQRMFDIAELKSAETVVESLLAVVQSGVYSLVIIDSVSDMFTSADANTSMADNPKMASHASLMTRVMKQLDLIGTGATVVFVNQVRMNFSPYGSDTIQHGGMAMKHGSSLDIEMMKPDMVLYPKTDAAKMEYPEAAHAVSNGNVVKFMRLRPKVSKSKISATSIDSKDIAEVPIFHWVDGTDIWMIHKGDELFQIGMSGGAFKGKDGQIYTGRGHIFIYDKDYHDLNEDTGEVTPLTDGEAYRLRLVGTSRNDAVLNIQSNTDLQKLIVKTLNLQI